MIINILLPVLLVLAALGKAVADATAHGSPRLQAWARTKSFKTWLFVTDKSWTNKYKDGDPTKGPAFWGSTTVFVAFTDLWHAANAVTWAAADAALLLVAWPTAARWWAVAAVVARRLIFQPVYSYLRA